MRILLFIPFYNCEKQIARVLKQITAYQNMFGAILLVDNRSQDKGVEVAKKTINELNLHNISIVQNRENYNLGGSHKVAFQYALQNNFDYLIVLHGDDQGKLSDLIPLINLGLHQQYDCLLGARFHQESKLLGYSKFRIFGNIVVNLFCSLLVKSKVLDMGSGLNMYKTSFLADPRIKHFPNDLTFNVYLLFHAYFNKNHIHYFPISWREEDQISNAKVFKQSRAIMKLIFKSLVNSKILYRLANNIEYEYDIIYKS